MNTDETRMRRKKFLGRFQNLEVRGAAKAIEGEKAQMLLSVFHPCASVAQ
jgi:hypothetical protein